jgi:hypothetical protein
MMTADDGRQDNEVGPRAALVLQLTLGPGDPLSGSVGLPDHSAQTFHGWIDFMSAINTLRAASATIGGPVSENVTG